MGYETDFVIETTPQTSFIQDLHDITNYYSYEDDDVVRLGECKWYEHMEDMQKLSKLYPNVLFTMYGYGEDNEDIWVAYFKNGLGYKECAEIIFPKFNPDNLR